MPIFDSENDLVAIVPYKYHEVILKIINETEV